MIYVNVKYFSVVCLSIYNKKLDVKTTLTFLRNEVKLLSIRHNLEDNCIKMPVFETNLKNLIHVLCISKKWWGEIGSSSFDLGNERP